MSVPPMFVGTTGPQGGSAMEMWNVSFKEALNVPHANHWGWQVVNVALLTGASQLSPICIPIAIAFTSITDEIWKEQIYDRFDMGTQSGVRFTFMVAVPLTVIIFYWVNGLLLLALDYAFPSQMDAYRIQESNKLTPGKVKKLFWNIFRNCFFVLPWICVGMVLLQERTTFWIDIKPTLPSQL
jgi:hypothetical protein